MRRTRWIQALLLVAIAAGLGCSDKKDTPTTPPPPVSPPANIKLSFVAKVSGVPVFMTQPPSDSRMFVVQQGGQISVVKGGTTLSTPFLDISGLVDIGGCGEGGLLSMAFRSDYATSGRFYVCYKGNDGDVIVARYHVSGNADVAAPTADEIVLRVEHSAHDNHNGGLILFGPDGKLYVGIGDGGGSGCGGGDGFNTGQNPADSLGNILRIDVSGTSGYTIPADNPYAGSPVWSWGLRNPWRFSFDRVTDDLYIGDVGQGTWEEVDVATAMSGGGRNTNFGWSVCEGTHNYNGNCASSTSTKPVIEYAHDGQSNCIIGGYVYRGAAIPALQGHYFYADNGGTWLRSFKLSGGAATESIDWSTTSQPVALADVPTSFAEDHQGELYILLANGDLYRIAP